ncbi:DMT family transporter [Peptococcus simiae]|uniref:DMT family transporter n=1 Tax=Peptococcus simiae TaxID=1643805 RepID=A0ABW9GX89_9FIRM
MSQKQAEILLALVIISRASAMLFSKVALEDLSAMNLLAWRFLLAFGLLFLISHRYLREASARTWRYGAILGLIFFLTMACEMWALERTAATNVALLENTAIIWTPMAASLLARRLPRPTHILCALVAFAGVACLLLGSHRFQLAPGDLYALWAAFLYTAAIIATDHFAKQDPAGVLAMGIIQVGSLGLLALLATPVTGGFETRGQTGTWLALAFLIVVCTGFGFTLQPLAQRYTSADRAGLFCGLNPLFTAILAAIFLGERLTFQGYLGLILILSAILLPLLVDKARKA